MSENPSEIKPGPGVTDVMEFYKRLEEMPRGASDMAKAVLILANEVRLLRGLIEVWMAEQDEKWLDKRVEGQ